MKRLPNSGWHSRVVFGLLVCTAPLFLWPGVVLVRDLVDPAMRGPGIPKRALELHARITPEIVSWADERVATARAAGAPLHDVAATEWPMFTAVFYLMATEALVVDWETQGRVGPSPGVEASDAVRASRDLLLDPSHHTWVRTHWGDDYLHDQNVFFRSLLIAGLTSHERITGDGTALPMLRDQVETLAADLDASPLGVLEDYPGECYPIDGLAAIGFIRRADAIVDADHSAFVERARRGFEGEMADALGLVPYRMDLPSGQHVQPSRGIGNSWTLQFVSELWGKEVGDAWYGRYEAGFYQYRWHAEGFREWQRTSGRPEWGFEIDAGPVIDGFGVSASAFGIGAARRNGRFDHAFALAAQASTASLGVPFGPPVLLRQASHAADAPYLGEDALAYFLTVQPFEGEVVAPASGLPRLAVIGLLVFFGPHTLGLGLFAHRLVRRRRRLRQAKRAPAHAV